MAETFDFVVEDFFAKYLLKITTTNIIERSDEPVCMVLRNVKPYENLSANSTCLP